MDKKGRAAISKLHKELDEAKGVIEDIKNEVETMHGEEEGKFENLSEGLQQGERGQAIEAARDALDEANNSLDEAITAIEEALSKLDDASQ